MIPIINTRINGAYAGVIIFYLLVVSCIAEKQYQVPQELLHENEIKISKLKVGDNGNTFYFMYVFNPKIVKLELSPRGILNVCLERVEIKPYSDLIVNDGVKRISHFRVDSIAYQELDSAFRVTEEYVLSVDGKIQKALLVGKDSVLVHTHSTIYLLGKGSTILGSFPVVKPFSVVRNLAFSYKEKVWFIGWCEEKRHTLYSIKDTTISSVPMLELMKSIKYNVYSQVIRDSQWLYIQVPAFSKDRKCILCPPWESFTIYRIEIENPVHAVKMATFNCGDILKFVKGDLFYFDAMGKVVVREIVAGR